MIKSRAPKRLWDDCLLIVYYIRSSTVHGTYTLNGDVSKAKMSGETSVISQFCEFEWFEWVMFQDKIAQYPDDHFKWVGTWGQALMLVKP